MTTGKLAPKAPPTDLQLGAWQRWKLALRVPSFSATLAPILVGVSYAWAVGFSNPTLVGLMVIAALSCHAGANLANDYFDHLRGVDTVERPGSSTVIQRGLLSPATVKRGMIVAFAVAVALGLIIVALTGPAILILAIACLAVAVFYTGGPKPLGYVALGEVAVFLTMGIAIVAGTFLALTGTITTMTIVIALPNAFLITAILHVNNMRDVDRDRNAGKRTVAMWLGRRRSLAAYAALITAAYLAVLLIVALSPLFWPILIVALTIPRGLRLVRAVTTAAVEQDFGRALRGTNRLLFEFGCLMALGIILGAALNLRPIVQ